MIEMLQMVGLIAIPTSIVLYLLEFILLMQSSRFASRNYRVGKICFSLANLIYPMAKVMFWLALIGTSITITKQLI